MKNNIENGIYIPEEQRNLIPSAARPGMKQLKCTTPGSVASTKRSRRSAANPQRLSAGRAKPTPTRSTIPASRSSTSAPRAA